MPSVLVLGDGGMTQNGGLFLLTKRRSQSSPVVVCSGPSDPNCKNPALHKGDDSAIIKLSEAQQLVVARTKATILANKVMDREIFAAKRDKLKLRRRNRL